MKPIHRHYFAMSTDPSEQLHYLCCIVSWLAGFVGHSAPAPDQYDDPNTMASSVIHTLKQLNLGTDLSQTAVRSGSGAEVCDVLNRLTDAALKAKKWRWEQPRYPQEKVEEEAMDNEPTGSDTAGPSAADPGRGMLLDDDDDDDLEDEFDDVRPDSVAGADGNDGDLPFGGSATGVKLDIMKPDVDAAAWRTEYERVLPQLKVQIRTDNKDWRAHVAQMTQYRKGIQGSLTETQVYLDKLHKEITTTLEKIDSREKYVNKQLDNIVTDYRVQQDTLAATVEQYRQSSGTVEELTQTLQALTDELDTLKDEIDRRANRMMDPKPMLKIKQDLQRLKKETSQMDLRIGVVQHTLLQAQLKNKNALAFDMHQLPIDF